MASSKNIGDQIFNAVQNAVDSQDFSNLQSTIEKSIGIAAESIARGLSSASDGIRRGQEQYALAQAKKRREEQMATIYANPSGQRSVGIALVGWGVVLGVPGLAGTIFTIGAGSILVGSILAAATVAGGALFAMGIKRLNLVNRFERYRDAIETIRGQLETQPRTKEGNFWHKKIYPNQVWLDGTYMAQPFYMEYETRCNGMHGCIDSYKQFMNIQKHMKDAKTGLYYHGYDESREMYWANPETGCSANFWLRAMGWFLVAMVDTLERMDNQLYYEYRAIMAMLKDAVDAMIAFQDAESGMFWQVVDKAGVEGNYLETSGSALFAYAVLKGVRLGYLPKRYTAYGEKAFYGTCDRHLGVGADGALQLGGICLVAGLGGATRRDGSLAYYFSEPIVENDAKGVGPLLLAYTEILAAQKQ